MLTTAVSKASASSAQNQFAFAPGDGRVKQIAAQHPPVLFHHRQNDHRKFAALRFMDGTTVSQNKLIPIVSIVSDFHGIEQDRDLVDLLPFPWRIGWQ